MLSSSPEGAMSEGRIGRIESRLDAQQEGPALLIEVRDLRRLMVALHHEVISTLRAHDPAPLLEQWRRETREQMTALRDEIDHRLTPLELTVRDLVRQERPPA